MSPLSPNSKRLTATYDLVLPNRSRADVRVGPRTGSDAAPQVLSGTHARAAGGAGTSGKSLSNRAGRRHQRQGFDGCDSGVHPAGFGVEDRTLYFAASDSHQ